MPTAAHVRPARAEDYEAFVRLFAELGTGDAPCEKQGFVSDMLPTAFIAEDDSGGVLGYAYFQLMEAVTFVRHVATAPESRRRGVGRALLGAVADVARRNGCRVWCLNVTPHNSAAIRLYASLGFAPAFESRALRIAWRAIEDEAVYDERTVARPIDKEDDTRVEAAMGLIAGQLAGARALPDRALIMLEYGASELDPSADEVLGAAIFQPQFPGATVFRVARPELALVLLRALRPFAKVTDVFVHVLIENQPTVADALIAAGAVVRLDLVQMKGPVPAP
jgi:GNAT superfamily N-acetyltransferase